MRIKKYGDIDFSISSSVIFDATILEIVSEGNGEKMPYKVLAKLEDSGDLITFVSWKFDLLEMVKEAVHTLDVFEISASCSSFQNYGNQVRVADIKKLGRLSNQKVLTSNTDTAEIKREIDSILNTYLNDNSEMSKKYLQLLKHVFTKYENKFFKWPAATKVHHNYEGGLARHSLSTCKNVISIWQNYKGENLDIRLLVVAAILHDIGKITEYMADGTRTPYGNLIPHPVAGFEMIQQCAREIGLTPESDDAIILLSHIIISHHGELEYGASTKPRILEAVIISRADSLDAEFEGARSVLANTPDNTDSERIASLDGDRLFKWKK